MEIQQPQPNELPLKPFGSILALISLIVVSGDVEGQIKTGPIKSTYLIKTKKANVSGTPLAWDDKKLALLTGYGRYREIYLDDVESYEKKSKSRLVYTRDSFRKSLEREFGNSYGVTQTQDFLIVHPIRQADYWPNKIQQVYQAFRSYFVARRVSIGQRTYPLVAVVFSKRSELQAYAVSQGEKISKNVVGYYSAKSNRVLIHDQSTSGKITRQNLETIIHEIAHQASFNCGIHSRFGDTPRWVVEGLGTMFEAKGVHNSQRYSHVTDRIHAGQFHRFQQKMNAQSWRGWLGSMVVGDRLFAKDQATAYCCAWAVSFYLMETQPYDYVNYLKKLAKLPPLKTYSQQQRLNDFTQAFGQTDRLEGAIKNYYSQFKSTSVKKKE